MEEVVTIDRNIKDLSPEELKALLITGVPPPVLAQRVPILEPPPVPPVEPAPVTNQRVPILEPPPIPLLPPQRVPETQPPAMGYPQSTNAPYGDSNTTHTVLKQAKAFDKAYYWLRYRVRLEVPLVVKFRPPDPLSPSTRGTHRK